MATGRYIRGMYPLALQSASCAVLYYAVQVVQVVQVV